MTAANRGKTAESLVKKELVKLERTNCCHLRLPDAHAGSMVSTLADFLVCRKGKLVILEVKETKLASRLPYQNMDRAQVAKMRMWQAAGAAVWVLIYHTTEKLWRYESVEYFLERNAATPSGSWNLSSIPTQNLDQIFLEIT